MKLHFNQLLLLLLAIFTSYTAKLRGQGLNNGEIHGNFQLDAQYYNPDSAIGAQPVPEKFLMNSFANLIYTNGDFSAGVRFESYLNTMLGFDPRYKGTGFPYKFATFNRDNFSITVGNYYEQFGSGMIFRSYEERGLGYDNAMEGVRVKYTLLKGIHIKGLIGKQRYYFDLGKGIVRGIDGEVALNELVTEFAEKKTKIFFGGSFVSKYEVDQDPIYVLPENVGAWAGRVKVNHGGWSFFSEYAHKINDPSSVNNYIYKKGGGLLVNTSYSQKGLGINLSGKVIDNMNFRSDRTAQNNDLLINFLPALTRQHTYNLAATIYPYATQPNGEMAYQGDITYTIKKGSKLGGKYGTTVLVNYAAANGLDSTTLASGLGYKADYTKLGKVYYKDFNVEIQKKVSKPLKFTLFYANFVYNKDVAQGKVNEGFVYANIEVLEFTYKFNDKHALRMELQGLQTRQDMGDWATIVAEYTISPNWFFSTVNQYNYGNPNEDSRLLYPIGQIGFIKNSTRVTLGYGRQRAGIFCIGGICRVVPASNGATISISSSF
ncbi:MAG: DUF6029 family protein [Bacteroidota bacterium]|jgi:hypothetical protein